MTKPKVKCSGCNAEVWDVATIDQRLNKCHKCGLRFDNPDDDDEVIKVRCNHCMHVMEEHTDKNVSACDRCGKDDALMTEFHT